MSSSNRNRGTRGEKRVISLCFQHRNDKLWCVNLFGEDASEGIEVICPKSNTIITSINEIVKSPPLSKVDVIIRFRKIGLNKGVSIKYFHTSNPSIVNNTSREKFINNEKLKQYVPTLDKLVGQYLKDPDNVCKEKSEVDRKLSIYILSEIEKRNVAAVIAYFTLEGTGKGDAPVPANGVLDMYHRSEQMTYKEFSTQQEIIDYVLSNWNRYIISIRGVHMKKDGNLRGNGMSITGNVTEEQMPWVCYYNDKGVMRPRGAICVRIKK